MNILQITLAFPPAFSWGGPVKTVHLSCKELVRRGHRVTVYCSNLLDKKRKIEPSTFEREVDGIRVVYFNAWNISWWPGTLGPVWLPEIGEYFRQDVNDFDVVHLNGYRNTMHLPVTKAARRMGIPYIVQPHGTMPIIVNSFLVKRFYDRLIGHHELEGLCALIALQESERQQAMAHGVPSELIEVIPNGMDFSERERVPESGRFRKRYGIAEDQRVILFLARINKKKGTDMLVNAFAQMDAVNDCCLVIAGPDDGQLAEVKGLVQRYGLGNRVILTGLLAHEQVLEAFRDADLFVLPCRADTFPMAIIEACLTDTPMVITDRCEIAHLVKNRVADVVSFDAPRFGDAMHGLLEDKDRYRYYKENCEEILRDTFSLSAVVDRLEALYERVVSEKRR